MNAARWSLITIILLGSAVCASQLQKPASDGGEAQKKPAKSPRTIDIVTGTWTYNDGTGNGELIKATFKDDDTVFAGDLIKFNNKQKTAVATGNLNVTDPEADVTGEKAEIFYGKDKRLVILTGAVHIMVKPKKDEAQTETPAHETAKAGKEETKSEDESIGEARKHPAEITCDKVEYYYAKNKKLATLTGNFKVVQKLNDKTRTMTADHAIWYGVDERVELYPPVHIEDTKGLVGDTKEMVPVSLKKGEEGLTAHNFTGKLPVEDENEETPSPPPGKDTAKKEPGKK